MISDKQKVIIAASLLIAFLFYSTYLYSFLPVKAYIATKETISGKAVWQRYNCNACHQVYGLGGFIGPDLTNDYSFRGKDFIKAFLNYGTAAMPNFHLSEKEVNDLLAYLKDIDASGKSDPRSFTIHYDGTIKQ